MWWRGTGGLQESGDQSIFSPLRIDSYSFANLFYLGLIEITKKSLRSAAPGGQNSVNQTLTFAFVSNTQLVVIDDQSEYCGTSDRDNI